MQSLTLTFLGTSSGTPSRTRNVSSVALTLDGAVLLFDCGEGTQHRLLESTLRSGAIDAIFITHLHGDHIYGLPGLLATLGMNGRTRPLDLIGPPDLRDYLESTLRTSFHNPVFEIRFHPIAAGSGEIQSPPLAAGSSEIRCPPTAAGSGERSVGPAFRPGNGTGEPGQPAEAGDRTGIYRGPTYTVIAKPLDHSIPSYGYCLIEDDHLGKFDPEKAKALGYEPGPIYAELIRARDPRVLGPPRPGRRIAYCTDTRPCPTAVELARNADLLVHESTYSEDMRTEADERKHSTAAGAARIAADAGAAKLILTHFSSRYKDVTPLLEEARAIFPNTEAGEDLMTVEVTR